MSSDSLKCSVCGGSMRMITVVNNKEGRSKRFKCTCGHCEDLKDDGKTQWNEEEVLHLDGFEETL